jgi:hypothetical protein
MVVLERTAIPTQRGERNAESVEHEGRMQTKKARHGAARGKAPADKPALKPYRGKPAVRNFRGDDGNVGIIRSPVRAIVLPDLLSWTPLASGPSANSSDTIVPTIATEGAKVGVGYLLKLGGAGSQTLSAWGAMTLIPGLLGTAWDAEAKNACKDVTGTNPQGW